ncbi:MAG: bifunctional hydroxymethylpyrimidine kinase/phosphomethylpyrimidine kinase [Nitrospirae bacterium GWC2_46_6]|nr:MAG: bifunctional hydroxymethylpyrimidine kinase/phosphomethylpyrimidine kinase [Nitrospirae bacterium GWA2_46_11]OGW22675.1 MAG: bifunctional hydroxymethylpyrimidine kinase/phosphomethylpyrimidine kinase [Nitrospirae bacterium GWC2_46_6]OGW23528.1 MAG: bifunctional hydroxymethylpyrimidine kinase/phosphomethylpyrimidine kinase [Nitrospirae bacterium GWB2_47_37]HAK87500.1 bifunctional hydroxymethylpyrimidine kinase/phosphomethylpyrimidine kinase [Nitrospiraceae bacterium]HCZ11748.1 bifunction
MKTALTIAGSDPTGGAGIQADIKVFSLFGVYGLSAVAALTSQNTYEVNAILKVDGEFLEKQLNTLVSDIRPDAVKTGMLFSIEAVKAAAKIIKGYELENLVIDPVTISSTGANLMEDGALDILKEELFPLAKVITPNIYEAAAISGVNIENEKDIERAAMKLKQFGPETVIITGGHFDNVGKRRAGGRKTMELVYNGKNVNIIGGEKIKGEYHGTGCAFSAAITACLAKGMTVVEAVKKTKKFMNTAIKNAHTIGKGMRLLDV